jgi:hypothetical protein
LFVTKIMFTFAAELTRNDKYEESESN